MATFPTLTIRHKLCLFGRQKKWQKRKDVTEALKAENQMEWAGRTNNICNQATEFVNSELI